MIVHAPEGRAVKRLTLLCPLLACAALAAPVPKPKDGAFRRGWDEVTDPDKDCQFTFRPDCLALAVPGEPHDLDRRGAGPSRSGSTPRASSEA